MYEKGAGKYLAPFLFLVIAFAFTGFLTASARDDPFPRFEVKHREYPGEGCFVFAVSPWLIILDSDGDPLFYRKIEGGVRNFRVQPGAVLTYYDVSASRFYAVDPYYHVVDSFFVAGDYTTDFHSLRVLPGGHVLIMGTQLRHVDMSSVVSGGDPNATARDVILQELDEDNHVIFQWNSRNHFAITDADTLLVDFTASVIDYVHANSFIQTPDSNFLLTSRNMSEVTKINRYTGEIIWRLGGKHNQFTDNVYGVDIRAVHSAVLLSDTSMLLFDNGTGERNFSQGLEYRVDQNKKKLKRIRNYSREPEIFTPVMGNIQAVNPTRRLIGWGKNDGNLICTVYDTVPEPVMEIKPADQDPYWSYSVSFGRWEDSVLDVSIDTLTFGVLPAGDSLEKSFTVVNTGEDNMILTGFSSPNAAFTCKNGFPEGIKTGDSLIIRVRFRPDTAGEYFSVVMLNFTPDNVDPATERIIRKVKLHGISRLGSTVLDRPEELFISVTPNPFHESFTLFYHEKITRMDVASVTGRMVYRSEHPYSGMTVALGKETAGIYFLYLFREGRIPVIRKIIKY